jgi:hypothetical protein
MELQIHEIGAVCDYAGREKSPKRLWLSFDGGRLVSRARPPLDGQRSFAPKLLEVYSPEDALLVGGFISPCFAPPIASVSHASRKS